jgi:hypothetical protein
MCALLGDRVDLSKDELYRTYWSHLALPREQVLECLELIERECGISAGRLRPGDALQDILTPKATSNPLRWVFAQFRKGDRENELSYQLQARLREHGTEASWPMVQTVDDFIHAWCGKTTAKPR